MPRPPAEHYELTETEKRDLIALIEKGRPLPERYRFLLFEDKREVELVWAGKSRDVCTTILPFQTLEHIDEPRREGGAHASRAGSGASPEHIQPDLIDTSGRQIKGWTNKLIWGDNRLILSSLKSGALRRQIEEAGGLKLIYIDPPFDVGADFSMDIEIGGETFHKEPNLLEQIAYRDTWGRGADSFIAMIYERLILMRDLLHEEGSIYVHVDWRMNALVRTAMAEVFGPDNFVNEIVWKRRTGILNQSRKLGVSTDSIYIFSRDSERYFFSPQFVAYADDDPYVQSKFVYKDEKGRRYRLHAITSPSHSPSLIYDYKGYKPPANGWSFSRERMEDWDKRGLLYFPEDKTQRIQRKQFLDESEGKPVQSLWDDIRPINSQAIEDTKYPTQKPEQLLERIIRTSSIEGDLIADFFCGSGTTAAVAEKLGRKWIATDLGKFGIHTTRKRLIQVQRERKAAGQPFRAFEVLNLGRYERQAYLNVSGRLSAKKKADALARKEQEFRDLILRAYKAQPLENDAFFHGKNAGRLVVVGPINLPVGRLFVEEVIVECRKRGASRADVLAFEFEMGLFPAVLEEAKAKGIDLAPKTIPPEVFDKRAVERGEVVFPDVAYIEVTPRYLGSARASRVVSGASPESGGSSGAEPQTLHPADLPPAGGAPAAARGARALPGNDLTVAIELTDFSVYYSQGTADPAAEELKPGKSQVVCEQGRLLKVSKDKAGIVTREVLTKQWTDWVDYWAVDFNYESRKEIIKVAKTMGVEGALPVVVVAGEELLEFEDRWTGAYIFENEWQSFRTRQNRALELTSAPHTYAAPGRYTVAVKVIDIFGNDTMTLVPVSVGP